MYILKYFKTLCCILIEILKNIKLVSNRKDIIHKPPIVNLGWTRSRQIETPILQLYEPNIIIST